MRGSLGLAGLVLLAAAVACEKDRPEVESPGPTVIVEQPGAAPASETGDDSATPPAEPQEFGIFEIVTTDVSCRSDAECVKDSCCHATSCVAIADAPDCSAAVCTLECRARTMDCNGGCVCQDGRCAARLWSAPTD
ncbi:MAG TPA: hypothetical protein VK034_21630 [Enhygromyxa sp.]|nr:hypothetical protein [Enhygromyxa sp.]